MAERNNTVVCSFDLSSPRITAYDVHEWIHAALRIPEDKITMIQIDGIKRQVFIKLIDPESMHAIIHGTSGRAEYKYPNGEIYMVNIEIAGMGVKRVRVANLPPEVPNDTLQRALTVYGKVLDVHTETWAKSYRYQVANGIRQVMMQVTRHLPSHLTVAGHRILVSYEGQPATCYGCGEMGHVYQGCPTRRANRTEGVSSTANTYAAVLSLSSTASGVSRKDAATQQQHKPELGASGEGMAPPVAAVKYPDNTKQDTTSPVKKDKAVTPTLPTEKEGGILVTSPLESGRGDGGPMASDDQRTDDTMSSKRDTQTRHENIGDESMEQDKTDKPFWSDIGESTVDESETYSLTDTVDDNRNRRRQSKPHKKMKKDKPLDGPSERGRILPRRWSSKGGKPE